MEHTLITGRLASGKTTKAVELFISNTNGLFFTQERTRDNLVSIFKIKKSYKKFIFDNYNNTDEIIKEIKNHNQSIEFIVIDYLQLFESFNIQKLLEFLENRNIKLILTSYIDRNGKIRFVGYNDSEIRKLFDNIIEM